jgi:hypothetical protein
MKSRQIFGGGGGEAQMSSCIRIRPVGTELFHADGQTDMMKLIVDFAILRSPNSSSVQSLEFVLHYAVVTFS